MKIAVTGATGFLGRYLLEHLISRGHECRCWFRPESDRGGLEHLEHSIQWVPGQLGDGAAARELLTGCRATVHAALDYARGGSRLGAEFDAAVSARNVAQSLELIALARATGVERFVFISSCAVYDKILADRPLDEAHPLWPGSHYGAYKAAVEAFVHSYAATDAYLVSALRPTGIYGLAHPVEDSKWYQLVRSVVRGETVSAARGGKEVHAADVARSVEALLNAPGAAGQAFNCYDRYVSEFDVAQLAMRLSNTTSKIVGAPTQPKNLIVTDGIRALGVSFGGQQILEETIARLVEHAQRESA